MTKLSPAARREAERYGAQFYLPNPDGSVALFYRIKPERYNDGTVRNVLQYLSSHNVWTGSSERNQAALKAELIPIEKETA